MTYESIEYATKRGTNRCLILSAVPVRLGDLGIIDGVLRANNYSAFCR